MKADIQTLLHTAREALLREEGATDGASEVCESATSAGGGGGVGAQSRELFEPEPARRSASARMG